MQFIKLPILFLIFLITASFWKNSEWPYAESVLKSDKIARTHFEKTAKQLATNHHISLLSCHLGNMVDNKEIMWCAKFMIQKPMTIDELRPLTHEIFKVLWRESNREPAFDNYLRYYALDYDRPKRDLTTNLVGLKLTLWDQNYDRPLYPHVAQVEVKESKIHYFYADPKTQALQNPPIVEDLPQEIKQIQRNKP